MVFLSNGFENDLGKVLEEPPKRTVFRLLLDKVQKGIFITVWTVPGHWIFFKFFVLFSVNIKTALVIALVTQVTLN